MRAFLVLTAAVLAWWLLGFWLVRGSERFYLLVPPVTLALLAIGLPDGWRGLLPYGHKACLYVAGLVLFSGGYAYFLASALLPAGTAGLVAVPLLWEALVTAYFLAAIKLLLATPWQLLRRGTY